MIAQSPPTAETKSVEPGAAPAGPRGSRFGSADDNIDQHSIDASRIASEFVADDPIGGWFPER
jgi:hypothetical protein